MRWSNVGLIFRREIRDQLRDRRTLFMIVVLPLLLYPLMGIAIAQLATGLEQKGRKVVIVGAESLPESPKLLNAAGNRFDERLFEPPTREEADKIDVIRQPASSPWADPAERKRRLRDGEADAVVLIRPEVLRKLDSGRAAEFPIEFDSADERSQITYMRVKNVLDRWNREIVERRLKAEKKTTEFAEPVQVVAVDVASPQESSGSIWAKLFPFLLVLMSLTGAFYPAIDLCAGEKERGTMETLLISPASRTEIVIGKFLTVMVASMATALLNLASMGLTGLQLARQIGALGSSPSAERMGTVLRPPTLQSGFWMILLLIPLSAFFSAVCLSLAVLARSMKEGQYYMTPLYLGSLPLIFATLIPGVELSLFTSLVPIMGVSLLLKALMQGDYTVAMKYFLPVLIPTIIYGLVALRWAIDQFQRESVLFREAERFELGAWLRHLYRDREAGPSAAQAFLCFALMISAAWFLMTASGGLPTDIQLVIGQIAFVLGPPAVMAFLLTRKPAATLRLRAPEPKYLLLGVGLALAVNPLVAELRVVVETLFPISETLKAELAKIFQNFGGGHFGKTLVLIAVVPAICEELAFRGFILSGLQRDYKTGTAILLSAFLFGFLHVLISLFHQFFNAALLGVVLGLLAVRSGSVWPGVAFHLLNNGMAVVLSRVSEGRWGGKIVESLYRKPEEGLYHVPVVLAGALLAAGLLVVLVRSGRDAKPAPAGTLPDPLAGLS